MKLTKKNKTIRVLTPTNKENWLTNGEATSKLVYLGKNESISNWSEITYEEKVKIENKSQE